MNSDLLQRIIPNLIIIFGCLAGASTSAQIVPDSTLPINSTVTSSGNTLSIEGGTRAGGNLFHSFQEFSVPTGKEAFFNNAIDIQNIFSRVTGGNISNIDGLIKTNGSANLFLLNPAGILFGPNARLNIGGSFVGTTANTIRFADGIEFSATNPTSTPLLTLSVPVGLQMGQNPGSIAVQGTGHRLTLNLTSIYPNNDPVRFQVASGNNLALVGGNITFDGGVINAESGYIELGSASNGTVNFNTTGRIWSFDYSNIPQFGDIQFSQQALADASGTPAGSIHLQGRNISLNDGSVARLTNRGSKASGNITVNASEAVELQGLGTYGFGSSLLVTDNVGNGASGDVVVSARQLWLRDGGELLSRNSGRGRGGNVTANVTDSIYILGFSAISPALASGIPSLNSRTGRGGDVRVSTGKLSIRDGGAISSITSGTGAAGNIAIDASESIEVVGENPINFTPSGIAVSSFNKGDAGQLTIDTSRLTVRDGATITAATQGPGNSGNLTIDASDRLEVSGFGAISGQPSKISAGATVLTPTFQQTFGLPPLPTGNTGDLIINTSRLQISNRGIVSASHEGVGNAGNLQVNANSIDLDRAGSITAATNSGEGGSMNLRTNTLIARNGSAITTNAGGSGNGGNMAIESPIIVGLENSDITANAVRGKGGNIQITTEGIFLAANSDITASSQLGISGTVDISNLNLETQSLVVLSTNIFTNEVPVIASSCLNQRNAQQGRFVVTGNGGLAETPDNPLMPYESAQVTNVGQVRAIDFRSRSTTNSRQANRPIQEATGFNFTPDGKVALVVDKGEIASTTELTCSN